MQTTTQPVRPGFLVLKCAYPFPVPRYIPFCSGPRYTPFCSVAHLPFTTNVPLLLRLLLRLPVTVISQLRCRYEDLLADKFDRVYFERPGKYHHPIGEKDYISVYQRK